MPTASGDQRPDSGSGSQTLGAPTSSARQQRQPWYRRRAARWMLAAATFVLGLFAGGIIVGLASSGPSISATPQPTVTVTEGAGRSASATPNGSLTGQATVNAACLQAVNDAQSSYAAIADLITALRNLNAAQIDQVIQRLEPLQTKLRNDLHACKVTSRLRGGLPSAGIPQPSGR